MEDLALFTSPPTVRKRDGVTTQAFDVEKIVDAIRKAWIEVEGGEPKPAALRGVAFKVARVLGNEEVEVETIQDAVETALMASGRFAVAKAYILYREKRAEARRARRALDPRAISDYIHAGKYARYQPSLLRREVYVETVDRVEAMHHRRYDHVPGMREEIAWAFGLVRDKRVLPSMRSMQFGGEAIEANNNRIYNCSFTLVDRVRAFAEAMFLLLSGCGVGYSVQFEHVGKLPRLGYVDEKRVTHHVIADTIEGWADAVDALVRSYVDGTYVEFSYHLIRPAGSPLRTSGGRAPGHVKLKAALEEIRRVLHGAQGRKLRPIECHRIMCHAAGAVLSGGIRRSAMIALFSPDDGEMMVCKTGDWWKEDKEPYFAYANNSVALLRHETKEAQFKRVFEMIREFGEPGFVFLEQSHYGTNPCAEIGLDPVLDIDAYVSGLEPWSSGVSAALRERFDAVVKETAGKRLTGWAFCNLCEINAAKLTSFEDFVEASRAATLIGTLQAGYTSFPYLGPVSEAIAERDALLGIGMTGMLDAPHVSCNPEYQRAIAGRIKEWNADYAARIGVNPAARTTCVKPSGTTSLELGSVGSGHHAHHARRYVRRVTADEYETVFQAFKAANPHMCVRKPDGKYVIEFPVQAPDGAILKKDMTAIQFLEMVRSTQQNWVIPGTDDSGRSPGLNHNVSNTVNVAPHEWGQVADYLWEHRDSFTGVSLLPEDPVLPFMPFEAVTNDDQERRFNELVAKYEPIDYLAIVEAEDGTDLVGEVACAGPGGSCSIA
jgi:ribonucleoside-triphosphate reductase (thioredoxin)